MIFSKKLSENIVKVKGYLPAYAIITQMLNDKSCCPVHGTRSLPYCEPKSFCVFHPSSYLDIEQTHWLLL